MAVTTRGLRILTNGGLDWTIDGNGLRQLKVDPSNIAVGATPTHLLSVTSAAVSKTVVADILGTTNQVTVSGGTGAAIGANVTLSLPQSIHTGASPTFAALTITGALGAGSASITNALSAGSASIGGAAVTSTLIGQWNTAYGWGNHSGLYSPLALKTALDAVNGIVKCDGSGTYSAVTDNSTNWNTAYTDRMKWDGGSTGLTAATGRTSLGLGTIAVLNANAVGALSGCTQFNVDNIQFDGNTISITDTNGSLVLTPNGTGSVQITGSRIAQATQNTDLTLRSGDKSTTGGGWGIAFETVYNNAWSLPLYLRRAAASAAQFEWTVNSSSTAVWYLNNTGTGAFNLNLNDGDLLIAGSTIISNAKAIANVTTISASSNILTTGGVLQIGNATPAAYNRIGTAAAGFAAGATDLYLAGVLEVAGATYFNQANADVDFRIGSQADDYIFFVDASLNRIGIKNNAPLRLLDVNGDIRCKEIFEVLGDGSNNAKIRLAGSGTNTIETSANALNITSNSGNSAITFSAVSILPLSDSTTNFGSDAVRFIGGYFDNVDASSEIIGPKAKINADGGYCLRLTNKTGSTSVKGQIVQADDTTDNSFKTAVANSDMPIGVVYEAGVDDGDECWIVVSGRAEVLMKDTVAAVRGYLAHVSDTAGRATNVASVPAATEHFREIGHVLESATGGTSVLAWMVLHFN